MAKKATYKAKAVAHRCCSVPKLPERVFSPNVTPNRARLIIISGNKWVNETTLRYCFLKSPAKWTATKQKMDVVRKAFKKWKDLGIGLKFKEVDSPDEAEIRIGFLKNDGHWSYIGRDVLAFGASERTMNLDKGDNWGIDTAIHEIGHSLGFPHEHQNPKSGIVWNEEAVYKALAKWPNEWPRSETYHNIIETIDPDEVQGSTWDPDSIMHYSFEAGLIEKPARYANGLTPKAGLSTRDKKWVKEFYPPLTQSDYQKLNPFQSVRLGLEPAEQVNFHVQNDATREYTISTFGQSDTVLVLFEQVDGEFRFHTGDDDSGQDYNANIKVKLYAGRTYIVRLRLYYQYRAGDVGVMMW